MIAIPREASVRARRTIEAAEVLHERAPAIAAVCARAGSDQIVVAVVEADCIFGGAWPIPIAELPQRVGRLEADGWTLTFAPQTAAEEIELRALTLARLAFKRWEALQGWASRHAS